MVIPKEIILKIIREQENIIGPIAWEEARRVPGLHIIDENGKNVTIDAPEKEIIERLVLQYERLFGRASREVCKEAVRDLLPEVPADKVPESLK